MVSAAASSSDEPWAQKQAFRNLLGQKQEVELATHVFSLASRM